MYGYSRSVTYSGPVHISGTGNNHKGALMGAFYFAFAFVSRVFSRSRERVLARTVARFLFPSFRFLSRGARGKSRALLAIFSGPVLRDLSEFILRRSANPRAHCWTSVRREFRDVFESPFFAVFRAIPLENSLAKTDVFSTYFQQKSPQKTIAEV
jgi:hypothetical protein